MDLKSALAIVSPFSSSKAGTAGEHTVRLSPGFVSAMNRVSGCRVAVEDVAVDAAVPLRDLRKILSVVSNPKLELKRSTLHVTGGGSTFKLKCFPQKSLLPYPAEPKEADWKKVDAGVLNSLSAISRVIDMSSVGNPMQSVRITPDWAAAATQSLLVTIGADFGTCTVTAHPEAVRGLGGSTAGGAICVDANRLWVSDTATSQIRWSQALATPWPDSVVNSMLPQTKAKADRVNFDCSIANLKGLSDRATLLMGGDEYGKIYTKKSPTKSNSGTIHIEGLFSRGSFSGEVSVVGSSQIDAVGISPQRLGSVLDAVGNSSDAFGLGDNLNISFGADGATSAPIILSNASVDYAVNALLMPVIIP